ncbi:MAG: glycosyltransferase [Planctomycetes bacterium]|nr:glycosyltransferase [Planctomycetota bacterium]
MKIVHYLGRMRLEDGGVVRAVLDLCEALAQRGHDVTMLTLDATDVPQSWIPGGDGRPRVETLERRVGPWTRLNRSAIAHARQRIGSADVVHLHVLWDPVCLGLARLARQSGVPYFISLHGMLDDWCMAQKGLKKRMYLAVAGRRLLEQAKAVHCTAQAEQDQSRKWYTHGRPIVVPLIFDAAPFEDLPGPELAHRDFPKGFTGDAVVLFVGRLHPIKRIDLLIDSAARLRDDGLAIKVLIVGSGEPQYEQALRRLVEQQQMSGRVEFLGFVSGRRKLARYQAADVVVLPSRHENWGFVLVEALACATPVVTTRAVNTWPELQASGGAAIVEPTSQAMASALSVIVRDQSNRDKMGQQGRAWVLETLTVDRVAERYESLYRAALA